MTNKLKDEDKMLPDVAEDVQDHVHDVEQLDEVKPKQVQAEEMDRNDQRVDQ